MHRREKTYDSDTMNNADFIESRRLLELKTKMVHLNQVKAVEESKDEEESLEKDPLFMNIDKIA